MADSIEALQRIQALFGIRGDGVSYQTKRALQAEGEGTPPTTIPSAAPLPGVGAGIGGPAPSPELLERVRKAQELRGQESLRRIMEQRARDYPTAAPDVPPAGGLNGIRG